MTNTNSALELEICGMSCGGCVKGVTAALGRVPGVVIRSVAVGKAAIEVDSDEMAQKAIGEIESAGFKARAHHPAVAPVVAAGDKPKCGCGPSCGK